MNKTTVAGVPAPRSTQYRSYLLRLWSADIELTGGWRASLEDPDTGKRAGFASLEELFIFLAEQSEGDTQMREPAQATWSHISKGEPA